MERLSAGSEGVSTHCVYWYDLYAPENGSMDPGRMGPGKAVFLYKPVVFRVHVGFSRSKGLGWIGYYMIALYMGILYYIC